MGVVDTFGLEGVRLECREGTSDWNTVSAIIDHDEYGLRDVVLHGKLVFDIGAHIGGLTVWAAVRGATVVSVEPIPENQMMVLRNARINATAPRVFSVAGGLGPHGRRLRIRYGGADTHHAYIGNPDGNDTSDREVWVETWSITGLIERFGVPDVVKLDCEGGEWHAFQDPRLLEVPLIVGEWHPDGVHERSDVHAALHYTHEVTFTGPPAGPGGFRAERAGEHRPEYH